MRHAVRFLAIGAVVLACVSGAWAVEIQTVPVGNTWNADDTHGDGYGGVDHVYNIGKFEVTAGQYVEFLNAVAATGTYGLYNPDMDRHPYGCQITRHGTSGNFTYDFSGRPSGTEADWADRPVNYVSWGDAARFCNWLHNGQPTGAQDLTTTEDGSYYLNGATSDGDLIEVNRKEEVATWVIPTEDEWYKAAYHKNDGVTGNYYDYPSSSDSVPGRLLAAHHWFYPPTGDSNNIGFRVAEVPGQPPDGVPIVPTVSEWGVLVMMSVGLTTGTLVFRTRRRALM